MKNTTPHWIAIVLLGGALIAIGVKFVILGTTAPGSAEDPRMAVVLTKTERAMVLGEMRTLLATTQTLIEALNENDLKRAENAARKVGKAAVSTMDFRLRAKLPLEFKRLGFGTHDAFDDIADMAAAGKPPAEIQRRLAEAMNNCIACHASYRLIAATP